MLRSLANYLVGYAEPSDLSRWVEKFLRNWAKEPTYGPTIADSARKDLLSSAQKIGAENNPASQRRVCRELLIGNVKWFAKAQAIIDLDDTDFREMCQKLFLLDYYGKTFDDDDVKTMFFAVYGMVTCKKECLRRIHQKRYQTGLPLETVIKVHQQMVQQWTTHLYKLVCLEGLNESHPELSMVIPKHLDREKISSMESLIDEATNDFINDQDSAIKYAKFLELMAGLYDLDPPIKLA